MYIIHPIKQAMSTITSTATTEEKMNRAGKKDESVYSRSKQWIINMHTSFVAS